MDRAKKKEMIEYLSAELKETQIILVAHNTGLTVAEMTALRGKVRAAGAKFKVAKNRLTKLALAGTQYEGISASLKGPTMLSWSQDPVTAAKALAEFAKTNEKVVLLGGAFGSTSLDAKGIEALSKLPSLDEIRSTIIGLINAPATKIAGVLQAPAGQLARVMGAYAAKDSASAE